MGPGAAAIILGSTSTSPVTLTFVAASTAGSGASSTYTGASIGTASSDRIVVVCVMARGGVGTNTITGVTCGGVSMTQIVKANNNSDATDNMVGIYALAVASGTTANIVVSYTSSITRGGIEVYAMTGKSSVTALDTKSDISHAATAPSFASDLTVGASGAALAILGAAGVVSSLSWSGVTQDDNTSVGGSNTMSSAHKNNTSAGTLAITLGGSSYSQAALVAASWAN